MSAALEQDIRYLTGVLNEVLERLGPPGHVRACEELLDLCRASEPDGFRAARERIADLSLEEIRELIKSLSLRFHLRNQAEKVEIVRINRRRRREDAPERPRRESIAEALFRLKSRKPDVRIIAVEPAGAAVLSGGRPGHHQMPGIGVGFIPEVLNRSIIDEVVVVTDEDAFACTRRLAREEGIVAGVSSGAAVHAALAIASRPDATGKMVVVILPDTGERYITTALFG
jgi:hypothetical protein